MVKASFYILWRLWIVVFPLDEYAQANLGFILGLLGSLAVVWGGVKVLQQTRLKLLVAYSTVMQIGYLFIAFPLASVLGWKATLYFILAHAIAKTAMFMVAGNILIHKGHDRIADLRSTVQHLPLTMVAFSLSGMSLMGLPPSGGFIAKWLLLEAAIVSGQWWWGIVLLVGGLLTGAYVFKVLGNLGRNIEVFCLDADFRNGIGQNQPPVIGGNRAISLTPMMLVSRSSTCS